MATYLERYQNGERVEVWRELVALGDGVRREPLYSDAQAVARETMRRAKHNVETIYEQLKQIGFEFQFPDAVFKPLTAEEIAELDAFESEVGLLPLSVRAWAEIVGNVNFMGTYPKLSYYDTQVNPFFGKALAFGKIEMPDLRQFMQSAAMDNKTDVNIDDDTMQNINDQLNSMMASMRNTFSQFFGSDVVGSVQEDYQRKLEAPQKEIAPDDQAMSDPLVVEFGGFSVDDYQAWQEDIEAGELDEDEPFTLDIAPDIYHKSNISGGSPYGIVVPSAAADAPLLYTPWDDDSTFVEYLRLSFEWAGFPGLQDIENHDEALLKRLKERLLPL